MANTWASRIQWIIDAYYDKNAREAARKIGTSHETLRKQASGGTGPSFATLLAVANKHARDIRLEWLVLGEGPREHYKGEADPRVATAEGIRARVAGMVREVEAEYGLESILLPEDGGVASRELVIEDEGKIPPERDEEQQAG